ncbi:hypothetical protein PM082_023835 [Marasmius tenuissimus]|nr:hypothetical protein PM082_023835 [Marasmius tenuissimus]
MKWRAERFRIHCLLVTGLFVASTTSVVLNTYYAILNLQVTNSITTWPQVVSEPADAYRSGQIRYGSEGFPRMDLRLLTYAYYQIGYAAQAITIASNVLTDVILVTLEMLFDLGKSNAGDSPSRSSLLWQYE